MADTTDPGGTPAPSLAELATFLAAGGWRYGTLAMPDADPPRTVVIARFGEQRVTVTQDGTGDEAVRLALVAVVSGLAAAA